MKSAIHRDRFGRGFVRCDLMVLHSKFESEESVRARFGDAVERTYHRAFSADISIRSLDILASCVGCHPCELVDGDYFTEEGS